MMVLQEFVYGTPKAQPRVKAVRRGNHAGVYDPGTANAWKALVQLTLHSWCDEKISKPLRVTLNFFLPRPRSHYGTGRNAEVLKATAPSYHCSTPDIDNLEKAVYDALSSKSGSGVWADDKQIVEAIITKSYAEVMDPVGMLIKVELAGE